MKKALHRFAATVGLLLFVLCLGVETSYAKSVTVTGVVSFDMAYEELGLINNERANAGLSPLEMSSSLQDAAMLRAAETSVSFSHTRPNGLSCFSAFPSDSSYPYAENIACGQTSAIRVTDAWMNSPGHRANMLGDYTRVGIGCINVNGVYFWVQCFAGDGPVGCAGSGTYSTSYDVSIATPLGPNTAATVSSQVYTGSPLTPKPTVKYGGSILKEGLDYVIASYSSNVEPGIARMVINGIGDYSGTIYSYFSINEPGSWCMFRLYNQWTGEHFYTSDSAEFDTLLYAGWRGEGVGWTAPQSSKTPVYRLYNPYVSGGDHHYTTSKAEYESCIAAGWRGEGVGWYSDDAMGEPLYRQYNPYAVTGTHNYTTDINENDSLVSAGWKEEGVAWYGLN